MNRGGDDTMVFLKNSDGVGLRAALALPLLCLELFEERQACNTIRPCHLLVPEQAQDNQFLHYYFLYNTAVYDKYKRHGNV